jgi:heterodisulfide reductase subunit C
VSTHVNKFPKNSVDKELGGDNYGKMKIDLNRKIRNEFVEKIEDLSGEDLSLCYQCGRCSGGCPSSPFMDLLPNQVIRLAQLGRKEELLNCETIWLCASCFTCVVRCPKGFDLAKLMETLRLMLLRQNIDHVEPKKIPEEERAALPQVALVSNFRKTTS